MAVIVVDEYQHYGIANLLVKQLIEHARANGIEKLTSRELRSNYKMRELASSLQMTSTTDTEDSSQVIYSLAL